MRRFRLLAEDYANISKGQIYPENCLIDDVGKNVFDYVKMHPEDWEEEFDKPKPLHKDTDLGYFAGLAMQGYISAGSTGMPDPDMIAQYAMDAAKELIKQLEKELPHNLSTH